MSIDVLPAEYGAWNPGLDSQLPRKYLPLSTVFNGENVSTSLAKALELSDFCGLPAHELVAFRANRLIVHELLIGVITGLSVPDGTNYEDLGENFREIASIILNRYIAPHREELAQLLEQVRSAASAVITQELSVVLSPAPTPPAGPEAGSRWRRLINFGKEKSQPAFPTETPEAREQRIVSEWLAKSEAANNRLDESCLHALNTIATAIINRQGKLYGDKALLTELAVTLVCNDHGSEVIGHALEPFFQEAALREGFRPLPPQERPIVMNVKGASASGKSTMRPLQRELAERLKSPWQEFALISPDIWRKFLLDYRSLGDAYKYAGTLTGHEVEIIDKKLDLRMAAKSARGEMSHLLIDRFRFDSFMPATDGGSGRLLTRFGDLVYMFFMITPPELTVERAWTRGLKVGRYKAVDDLLAHNVEAYTGMPELFFTWALSAKKRVHYEFLDNSVEDGERPRTVAYGWNGEMTILDVKSILDIDRFRKININAQSPEDVYAGKNLAPECNTEFLKRCARMIPTINFANYNTGQVYARLEHGQWAWRDEQTFADVLNDPEIKSGLEAIAPRVGASTAGAVATQTDPLVDKAHTLGAWGEAIGQ
jgi:hypothetical protein